MKYSSLISLPACWVPVTVAAVLALLSIVSSMPSIGPSPRPPVHSPPEGSSRELDGLIESRIDRYVCLGPRSSINETFVQSGSFAGQERRLQEAT
jgi:hypothetical protein